MSRPTLLFYETNLYYTLTIYIDIQICFLSRTYIVERSTRLRSISYNFTEVQVSRVIIVLLLQNCFIWCKDHTHQAILTTELLELEGWQLNAKI